MHKRLIAALFLTVSTSLTGLPLPLYAQSLGQDMVAPSQVPLVVIRFNQRNVRFEQSLYKAMSQALAIKPSAFFDLVSVVPATGDPEADAQRAERASRNLNRIVTALQQMGLPPSRYSITSQPSNAVMFDEVQIYVR